MPTSMCIKTHRDIEDLHHTPPFPPTPPQGCPRKYKKPKLNQTETETGRKLKLTLKPKLNCTETETETELKLQPKPKLKLTLKLN